MAWNPLAFFTKETQQTQAAAPAPAPASAPAPAPHPLDGFSSFFGQPAAAPAASAPAAAPAPATPPQPAPAPTQPAGFLPSFNKQAIGQQLGQLDFSRMLPAEVSSRLAAGDMTALNDALNVVGRTAVGYAMQFAHGVGEQAATAAFDKVNGSLDSRIRDYQLNQVAPTNPALQHPNAQPVVQALTKMFAQQDPSLRPEDAVRKAEEYFVAMGQITTQQTQQQQQQQQQQHQGPATRGTSDDFSHFLVEPSGNNAGTPAGSGQDFSGFNSQ